MPEQTTNSGQAGAAPRSPAPSDDARSGRPDSGARRSRDPLLGQAGETLAALFPEAPERTRNRLPPAVIVTVYILATAVGAIILLSRQSGRPAWDTMWAEDQTIFLPGAVFHPWSSLMQPHAGYLQLVPRLIAAIAAALPLADAAMCFTVAGALIASGCAVLVFHASRGHVQSASLRAVLAAGIVLLPTALIEIANNGVGTPWYLMFAVFWVLLWRPRSWAGMAVAALVCLAAMSSEILVALYLPLVLARVVALPRLREHAATLGLAAGAILQVPAILRSPEPRQLTHLAGASDYYVQHVVLASVGGLRLAAGLEILLGSFGAVALGTCVVAMMAQWGFLRGDTRVRIFIVTALSYTLLLSLVPTMLRWWVVDPHAATLIWLPGSRYTVSPVLLIDSVAVVTVDAYLRRANARIRDVQYAVPAMILIGVLSIGWLSDFRHPNERAIRPDWSRAVSAAAARCDSRPVHSAWLPAYKVGYPCSVLDR